MTQVLELLMRFKVAVEPTANRVDAALLLLHVQALRPGRANRSAGLWRQERVRRPERGAMARFGL